MFSGSKNLKGRIDRSTYLKFRDKNFANFRAWNFANFDAIFFVIFVKELARPSKRFIQKTCPTEEKFMEK